MLCIRESISQLVQELGALLATFTAKCASFLERVYYILLNDVEGGLKAKQGRLSLQLQIQALKKMVV